MVNGKPQLTFGNSQISRPAKAPRRISQSPGTGTGRDFASYLPPIGNSKAAVAKQEMQNGIPSGTRKNTMPAGYAPQPLYANTLPPSSASGKNASNTKRSRNLPMGTQSLSEARSALGSTRNGMGTQSVRRSSAKTAPAISGQPITGRRSIGMTDTRKTTSRRSTLTAKGDLSYASNMANAARAHAMDGERQGQVSAPSMSYSSFMDTYQGGGQSFITHGFGARHVQAALKNAGYERSEHAPVQTRARLLSPNEKNVSGPALPGIAYGSVQPVKFSTGQEAAQTSIRVASHRKTEAPQPVRAATHLKVKQAVETSRPAPLAQSTGLANGGYPARSLVPTFHDMAKTNLGALAAKFESGSEGIAAIGYDHKGGTSYGKYQISSRAGTMSSFINYLSEHAPDLAARLSSCGSPNTGRRTGKMPTVWREIAAEQPDRFESLQSDFIRTSHFEPAMHSIAESTGIGFQSLPHALQEVLFSTAVQHGPAGAVRIVSKALGKVSKNKLMETGAGLTESFQQAGRQLIKQIYALRAGQFTSSTARVQAAVRNRLQREMHEALQML